MPNITLSVDEDTVKKVRKIAVDKNTTLTALVRNYLIDIASREDHKKQIAIKRLSDSFKASSREMGPRIWEREMLHER
jgi:hypothetical protein